MKILGRLLRNIFDRLIAVTFALLFLQAPHLVHQYTVALSGALYESKKTVKSIRASARLNHKTVDEFIQKHLQSTDPDFTASGKVMSDAVERYRNYKESLKRLKEAGIISKPFIFLSVVDWALVREMNYKPGLSLSIEDAIYAIAGIIAGLLLFHGFIYLLKLLFRKRKPNSQKSDIS